jgi:hypothetical protein
VRKVLILAALPLLAAAPAAAQHRMRADSARQVGQAIEQTAPAIDRATGALLDLDIGPLLDAAHPYGARGRHRTLREVAARDDPRFERRMHDEIYRTTAGMARTMDAIAAAEPQMRRSLRDLERAIDAAIQSVPDRAPPRDADDEGPDDEPY